MVMEVIDKRRSTRDSVLGKPEQIQFVFIIRRASTNRRTGSQVCATIWEGGHEEPLNMTVINRVPVI